MRNWAQHKDIADKPPSARSAELERLHRVQPFDAISRTEEDDDGHSILQKDMPDDKEYDCELEDTICGCELANYGVCDPPPCLRGFIGYLLPSSM